MRITIRLMIFGLPRGASVHEVQGLVQPFGASRLAVFDVPGENDQAVAILRLGSDHDSAARLSRRLAGRCMGGHRLQTWLTFRPWA